VVGIGEELVVYESAGVKDRHQEFDVPEHGTSHNRPFFCQEKIGWRGPVISKS
jgi:hypothetical protein